MYYDSECAWNKLKLIFIFKQEETDRVAAPLKPKRMNDFFHNFQ